jgi:hypothetical protein
MSISINLPTTIIEFEADFNLQNRREFKNSDPIVRMINTLQLPISNHN